MGFSPKKSPEMIFPTLIIWAKALFFFEQLFPVVARTWWIPKSDSFFLGPKFRFLVQKSDFCHTTPILVNDPFLALGMTVNFRPWERFFDFPFRSYSCFRKKIRLTRQKVFSLPTVGAPSDSNSPSALSVQALRACALRARAGKHQRQNAEQTQKLQNLAWTSTWKSWPTLVLKVWTKV